MAKVIRSRSNVSIDLPDELIAELLQIGKCRNVSVRQQIREAFTHLSRATEKPSSSVFIADERRQNRDAKQSYENFLSRFEY